MKIDRNKLKKSTTDVPADCRNLIEKLKSADENFKDELKAVKNWTFGKCELYHWSDILDKFDEVLERACKKENEKAWTLACDQSNQEELKDLLLSVLHFTALLIEHSFSRHLYNSMEHLTTLLSSSDMTVVLAVLNLLYVFSKRSNFITRLSNDKKQGLVVRLTHLAESWGGKDNGFGLAECCKNDPISSFPASATTLHFEFYLDNKEEKNFKKHSGSVITSIHLENVDKSDKLPSEIMEELLQNFKVPESKQMLLYTHIRLAYLFSKYEARVQCVQARLQALAILVYSTAMQENMNSLLYPGLIEELVDIVEIKDDNLVEIKAASLRTLTSIIHLERNPKLNNIIDATGAASYHGFLPCLVRSCIQHMTDATLKPYPQLYATALFSFLYHLASYENGVEALVSCGMMECLLKVINWYGDGQENIIQFVTRAVRVVDLITNMDMAAFQTQGGLNTFLNRLEYEVDICRKENPFEIRIRKDSVTEMQEAAMELDSIADAKSQEQKAEDAVSPSTSESVQPIEPLQAPKPGVQCYPQRAALLKSMLNFLKKATPDPSFSEGLRHLMEGSLPKSLRHIISNAEYYGPSLFLLATDVVTVYVFQEPSLLSSLQDSGLTDVVLHALLIKDVPATREVLASLPNVFSALCLNSRGLESFVNCKPFDRLFKVLLSPDYLPAMRKRRSSDPFGDTASNLGNAMDELMRHQPSLKSEATKAIIKLLEEVCAMGMDTKFICQKSQPKVDNTPASVRSPQPTESNSSDEEEEEEDIANTQDVPSSESKTSADTDADSSSLNAATIQEKKPIPLMDYVLNVMKFVEAILSNNATDDHCKEFVAQKGLQPLMTILGLPNLPLDFPSSTACQAVSVVCKSILTLSRESQVLKQGLLKLNEVLQSLESLHQPLETPGGSVLLKELANVAHLPESALTPQSTPLLHSLSSCHAYILMFVHVCRMGQTEIRTISVNNWGTELGLNVLEGLSKLYISLVWESTLLLALCSEDVLPPGSEFGKLDMEKIFPKNLKLDGIEPGWDNGQASASNEMGSNGVSAAMESLSTSEETPMETSDGQNTSGSSKDKDKKARMAPIVRPLKPLLSVSSRLCRALAELFGLLVKLCVGSPVRQRRSYNTQPSPASAPSQAVQNVARNLSRLLSNGLQWAPPDYFPLPKLRLTFLVCSVGFASPMLFDEKKHPYHLMLQQFVKSGGQKALFDAFHWALTQKDLKDAKSCADDELPEGTGEFIDAWLLLIEKMVNPKNILESSHALPAKSNGGFVPFSPVQYLISTQKAAFHAVMLLWNKKPIKVYGGRISESILAILSHIIKGENIIKEQLAKEKETVPATSTAGPSSVFGAGAFGGVGGGGGGTSTPTTSSANPLYPAVPPIPTPPEQSSANAEALQQLMDMGFTREHSMDALLHTNSLEQATEWILTHPPQPVLPPSIPTSSGTASNDLGMMLEMSEEDQMMRAIAMSLGENILISNNDEEKAEAKKEKSKEDSTEAVEEKEEPLEKTVLDDFTESVLPGCLKLLDTLPETVYRVCDLLVVVTQRNGIEWQKRILAALVEEIQKYGKALLAGGHVQNSPDVNDEDKKQQLHPNTALFAARLHLFSLLFEEAKLSCAESAEKGFLIDLLVQALSSGQEFLSANKDFVTLKWLAPLLLLLDLYEKVAIISKRKRVAEKLLSTSHTWKWYDDSGGRWCKYSSGNNTTIDNAYRAGETSVRFTASRRRYTVYFSSMMQINEDTGNRRPIMLTLPTPEEKQGEENKAQPVDKKTLNDTKMETDTDQKPDSGIVVLGLNHDQICSIIRSVVSLVNIPVEADSLHAALRLVLRVTREHQYALLFAELGGAKALLKLNQTSYFQGFISLVNLIFRHIFEEPATLRHCMERAIKKTTSGIGVTMAGTHASKELHYVLRVLGPAACRSPKLFTEVIKSSLRLVVNDDEHSKNPNQPAPQMLKYINSKTVVNNIVPSPIREVVIDLLNCLIAKYHREPDAPTSTGMEVKPAQPLVDVLSAINNERISILQQQNSIGSAEEEVLSQSETSDKTKDGKTVEDEKKQTLLFPKSIVLRLLSEMVKSYSTSGCTQLIVQHTYYAGQTELVQEESSMLAYVMDNLLPQCQVHGDKDCPALARVFIANIASCNNRPEAQMTVVSEIKNSLQRALVLPESSEKHVRIQSLTNLVSVIIESCPSPGQIPNQVFKGQQTLMNFVVKCLLKKGLVNDLARIAHNLDLSSPYMANTINSALKPLETLSRSVNQPAQSVSAKTKKTISVGNENLVENNTTVAAEDSGLEGDREIVAIEDITDQADQHDDLEETSEFVPIEPDEDADTTESNVTRFENVIDEILNRNCDHMNSENEVIAEIMDSDLNRPFNDTLDNTGEVTVAVEDMDFHDSRMVSQELSIDDDDDDDDGNDNTHDVHDEESDDSCSDADEDDNEDDVDNDDQDEEDDEEDDEDDQGSDMEAEDEDDYIEQEIDDNNDINPHLIPVPMADGGVYVEANPMRFNGLRFVTCVENENGTESVPLPPSNVMASHPLLVRQPEVQSVVSSARAHRTGRQRSTLRYNALTQTLHASFLRPPNTPVILQRLLGPSIAGTLTSAIGGQNPTQVILGNDPRQDDDFLEDLFQEPFGDGSSSGAGVFIPSTLTRWSEEVKVLDGDSVHDCVTALKPEIIEGLEKYKAEEIAERKEKKKKTMEEEAAKKEKAAKGSETTNTATSTSVNSTSSMEVSANGSLVTSTPATLRVSLMSTALPNVNPTSSQTQDMPRQTSADNAVNDFAEFIASSIVNDISPTPNLASGSASSFHGNILSDAAMGSQAFVTPAQPMPIVTPSAPEEQNPRHGNPSMNLESLLASDDYGMEILNFDSPFHNPLNTPARPPVPIAPHQLERSITPEISSGDAVTIQSSESSEDLHSPIGSAENVAWIPLPESRNAPPNPSPSDSRESRSAASAMMLAAGSSVDLPSVQGDQGSSVDPVVPGLPPLPETMQTPAPAIDTMGASETPETAVVAGTSTGGATAAASSEGSTFPEGVDPSFLAALPDNIRQEVIAEQMRLQRIQQSAREQAQQAQTTGSMQVNPEFLAALPPAIQEEVLAQQRAEQARLAAQTATTSAPDSNLDAAGFLATLPSNLRQQVLADMDDSMVAVLPPDLAAEAQTLRRDLEERHRRLVQERLFTQGGSGSLSAILRHSGLASRLGGRYALRAMPRSGSGSQYWGLGGSRRFGDATGAGSSNAVKLKGRHLLDHEALTCLLVLLFVDEPKLNTSRLHRVLRNLCYHAPTRIWIIRALLSMLHKTGDSVGDDGRGDKQKKKSSAETVSLKTETKNQGSWLSVSLEAALGCRANIFQIQKTVKKHTSTSANIGTVTIHPQAAPVVCRHVLDTLIALAKVFPSQFLPASKAKESVESESKHSVADDKQKQSSAVSPKTPILSNSAVGDSSRSDTDFWELLIKLDNAGINRKGKGVQKAHVSSGQDGEANFYSFETCPLGQLMSMLSHPVVRRSQLLTDRLLRLLGLVSIGLSEITQPSSLASAVKITTVPNVTTVLSNSTVTLSVVDSAPTPSTVTVTAASGSSLQDAGPETAAEPVKPKEITPDKEETTLNQVVLEDKLHLAVKVLTSKSCSEEGLEDATNLLLQLSWANTATRMKVLNLLLGGAKELGQTVCSHIRSLLEELRNVGLKSKDEQDEDSKDGDSAPSSSKSVLHNRYMPGTNIVISAPKNLKAGRELQLPSMTQLTSKTSSQQFLLRILKVIVQLRDAAKSVVKKPRSRTSDLRENRSLGNMSQVMAALEAEAEAIMEMVGRRVQQGERPAISEASAPQRNEAQPAALPSYEAANSLADTPSSSAETPMDVDQPGTSGVTEVKGKSDSLPPMPRLSEQLELDDLWHVLGDCLLELAKTTDHHAVLILQPAVEAFFIVHAGEKDNKSAEKPSQKKEDQLSHLSLDVAPGSPAAASSSSSDGGMLMRENSVASVSSISNLPPDTQKFLKFAETHRTVLNQILRQSTTPLADGPFSVLVDHTRILDFDVKRRYFRQELEALDEGMRREDLAVHVRRENVFEDSFRELFRRTADEWKHRFYIVFEGEEGQDAGGLLREWYIIISREIFNPMYALFCTSPGDRVTYTINHSSHCNSNHLSYFKFVGRIIAKAIYDNKLLECYFTRSFYKHIIGHPVNYTDMESEDYSFYKGLVFLLDNNVADLGTELTFTTEVEEFGVTETRELKPNGANILVTEDNKKEYVKLVCQMRMTGAIRKQLTAFMEGFYDIIPKRLISIFNEQELELLISGLPTIDIEDLKTNSEYHKYQATSLQVQWFWRALRSFDQPDRAKFLQFVTGTSKVPLQGFAFLEGMNGYQKFQIHRDDRSTDRLPVAHTCFNQLDLPAYETYDKLKKMLLLAINECSEGFGLA